MAGGDRSWWAICSLLTRQNSNTQCGQHGDRWHILSVLIKKNQFQSFSVLLLRLWFASEMLSIKSIHVNMNEYEKEWDVLEMYVLVFHTWECNCEFPDKTMIYTRPIWISIGWSDSCGSRQTGHGQCLHLCLAVCVIQVAENACQASRHLTISRCSGMNFMISIRFSISISTSSRWKQLFLVGNTQSIRTAVWLAREWTFALLNAALWLI